MLPDKIVVDLKMLIHQISKVCLQIIKPETPVVLELISKDFSLATVTDWELDKSHWINVIAQLQLSDQQVHSILEHRDLIILMILYASSATHVCNAYNIRLHVHAHYLVHGHYSSRAAYPHLIGIECPQVKGAACGDHDVVVPGARCAMQAGWRDGCQVIFD
jgi:hypothetical protein